MTLCPPAREFKEIVAGITSRWRLRKNSRSGNFTADAKTMKRKMPLLAALLLASPFTVAGQGTIPFQNLDFEDGTFLPILGDPFNRVQFSSAMPGWTGYVGTNQISWILKNNLFLDSAGVAIWGPDSPSADFLHGQYFVVLQYGNDISGSGQGNVGGGIAQTGTIPLGAQSIRFITTNPFALTMNVMFAGNNISMINVGTASNGRPIWGGDVSSFAGLTGELKFQGAGYLDYIQFSPQSIPEPSALGLLGLGTLLFGCRARLVSKR